MKRQPYERDPDWWKPRREPTEREREIRVAMKVVCNRFRRSMLRIVEEMRRAAENVKKFIEAHPELKERDGPDS